MEAKTLVELTAEKLLAYIKTQSCRAGDRLPTEAELTGMLGVSRNTLREALRALVSRNILEIKQGAGIFISEKMGVADDPLGFSMVEDRVRLIKDLLQVRVMLEPPIAALAAQNATSDELLELERLCAEVERCIDAGEDFTPADQQFHLHLARCSHNLVTENLIPVITEGVGVFSSSASYEYTQTVTTHRRIVAAVCARRAADAQQAMLYHLLYNQNRYELEARE